jgi:hypothetical protein
MDTKKFKFNVINKKGQLEAWSGIFESEAEADEWYLKHSDFLKTTGLKFIKIACSQQKRYTATQ